MLLIIRGYRRWVSPALPPSCRFLPSCSEYAQEALERHGAIRGSMLAAGRLLACHPWGRSGFDPVPPCPSSTPGTGRLEPFAAMAGGSPEAAPASPHPEDPKTVLMTS